MSPRLRNQLALTLLTVAPRLALFEFDRIRRSLSSHSGSMLYDGYLLVAQSLATHGVYGMDGIHSITTRAPLLPLLLVPGVLLGIPVLWAFWGQLVLAVGAVLNTESAARSFGASQKASFIAAVLLAVNPWFIRLGVYVSTAVTAVFLITCLLRFLAQRAYVFQGITGGLLALCHPACILSLVGAIAADAIRHGWQNVIRGALVSLGIFVLILSPWVVRDYMLTGRLMPGVDGFGYQYLMGSAGLESGKPRSASLRSLMPPGHEEVRFGTVDSAANAALNQIAVEDLKETALHDPGRLLYRCLRQCVWFWVGDLREPGRISIAHLLYLLPLLPGSALALYFEPNRAGAVILISLPTIAIHSIVTALSLEAMYSLPVMPVLAVMSACGVGAFRRAFKRAAVGHVLAPLAYTNRRP